MLGSALLGSFYWGSATAQTPGLPPPLPVGRKAVTWARSGIARSNATRSNYIRPNITVLLEKYRYPDPPVTVDLTPWTRMNSLAVKQAVNDEADSCSLTLKPELPPEHIPQVGDMVAVGLATEATFKNSAYPAAVRADGAVAYWRLGEASGTVANDSIGTAHGTISGGVTLYQDSVFPDNASMKFDGATGQIAIPPGAYKQNAASIELWFRITAANTYTFPIFAYTGELGFTVDSAWFYLTANPATGSTINLHAATLPQYFDGNWHHVVGVIERGTPDRIKLYCDGVLANSQELPAGSTFPGSGNPALFGAYPSPGYNFNGWLDDIAYYSLPLSPEKVAEHYHLPNWRDRRITGGLEFAGSVVIKQHDRRPRNESPWIALQCQDWMWFFDAQLVNAAWPKQSAWTTIQDLVTRFVNYSQLTPSPPIFTIDHVLADLPMCEAFEAVNWRASDVLRHLANELKGGFYIDARRDVHAWANGAEPQQSDPRPLTNFLSTLKTFRHTVDATPVRKRVVVEGIRTTTLVDVPALTVVPYDGGVPVADARPFVSTAKGARRGSQWVEQQVTHALQAFGENPFSAHVLADKDLSEGWLSVDNYPPWLTLTQDFALYGWIKIGDQFLRYSAAYQPAAGRVDLYVNAAGWPFGKMITPVKIGDAVTWVDWIDWWRGDAHTGGNLITGADLTYAPLRTARAGTEVVIRAEGYDPDANQPWTLHLPPIETVVSDARYGYVGAQARASQDVVFFRNPTLTAAWTTTDYNARPGRAQVIQLTEIDPVNAALTILSVDLTFELRHLAPRRGCTGALVKPAMLLDVLTTNNA